MLKQTKKQRGITLIALVITIIVLLILAAITINALSGDNGILKRASEAKQKTKESDALEKVRLAVMTATTNGIGEVDLDDLKSELQKVGATVNTTGDLPWNVVSDGYMFRINEDLSIDKILGIGISKKKLKLLKGESETLTATVTEGITGTIKWESSNPSIVTVENGKVTAVGTTGTVTITVKVEGTDYSDTCTVSIVQKVTAITAEDLTVGKNGTGKINVTTTPSGLVEDLIYTSESTDIATVTEDGTVTGVAEGTATITIKGKVSTSVSTTCTVTVTKPTVSVTAAEIAANKKNYYGKIAQNYTQGGLTYRIFYVDTENRFGDGANTIYLKADYKEEKPLSTDISTLTTDDIQRFKNMNPLWNSERGTVETSSWENNEKASAWLCAPSQWTTYVDGTKANYAIGAPSADMYVASYNDVPHLESGNNILGLEYSSPGYKYTVNGKLNYYGGSFTDDGVLDSQGYNGMYAGTGKWWLASPSYDYYSDVCCVYGTMLYGKFYDVGCDGTNCVGPLVSLKAGFKVQIEE